MVAYKETLKLHVQVETSGYFEDLLVALINANRDESETVDKTQAIADAKALYLAGKLIIKLNIRISLLHLI